MAKSPLIMCENKPWLPAQKPFLTKAYISALFKFKFEHSFAVCLSIRNCTSNANSIAAFFHLYTLYLGASYFNFIIAI